MDAQQKRYILENLKKKSQQEIARDLGLKERHVRKFLLRHKQKPSPAPLVVSSNFSFRKNWKFLILVLFLLFILGFSIYSNTFKSEFVFDDLDMKENPVLRNPSNLAAIWRVDPGRFLTYLTFALNYHFGGEDVFGFHLVNILIHVITSFMVLLFIIVLFETPKLRRSPLYDKARWIAVFSSFLFLSHPLQTQAVTYTIQRAASLATLFYVASLTFYLIGAIHHNRTAYLTSLAAAVGSMFTKPITVTLPLAILFSDFFLFPPIPNDPYQKRFIKLIPFLATVLITPLSLISFWGHGHVGRLVESATMKTTTPYYYFLTQMNVIVFYLRLVFLPTGQSLYHGFLISHSLFEPKTFLSFLFLSFLFLSGLLMVKKNPLFTFCTIWFFLALSIESSFFPINQVIYEHRMYLPMVGVCLAISSIFITVVKNRKVAGAIFLILTTSLSVLTYRRNEVWKTRQSLWLDVSKKYQGGNRTMTYDENKGTIAFTRVEHKPFNQWSNQDAQ